MSEQDPHVNQFIREMICLKVERGRSLLEEGKGDMLDRGMGS